jgi:death-on-curing protein
VQPIFAAIEFSATHRDSSSAWCSNTIQTARSQTSGEYLVFLFIAPYSQVLEPPTNPGRFRVAFFATDVFLRLNGYKLKVDAEKAHRFLIGLLEQRRCTFNELLQWIRTHVIKL